MADEAPESVPIGPFRLTTPGDRSWTRPIPWVLEACLVAITVYVVVSGPLDAVRLVAATGLLVTMAVVALPGIVQHTPAMLAWTQRSATLWPEGVVIDMPGRDPLRLPWDKIARATTRPMSLGAEIPPSIHMVTDFYDIGGERIAEFSVHHSGYRRIGKKADVNEDGPALLAVLLRTPSARALDLASRTLVELVVEPGRTTFDGLSPETVAELEAGLLWTARRSVDDDRRDVDRVPDALVLIDYLLHRRAQRTARVAIAERPYAPLVRYYLAHAILTDIGRVAYTGPAAVARRNRLKEEALALLEGLCGDREYGQLAADDLKVVELRTFARRGASPLSGAPSDAGEADRPDTASQDRARARAEDRTRARAEERARVRAEESARIRAENRARARGKSDDADADRDVGSDVDLAEQKRTRIFDPAAIEAAKAQRGLRRLRKAPRRGRGPSGRR